MKKEARSKETRCKDNKILSLFLCLCASMLLCSVAYADLSETIDILERIPVQHNGRVKPFQSFAEENTLQVTGSKIYQGVPATQIVWSWITGPDTWDGKAMIPVSFRPLRKDFSVMMVENKISPEVLKGHQPFLERIDQVAAKQKSKQDLSALEKESLSLYDKAQRFQAIGSGLMPGWIPNPKEEHLAWFTLQSLAKPEEILNLVKHYPVEKIEAVRNTLANFVDAFRQNPASDDATQKARLFSEALRDLRASKNISLNQHALDQEIIYDRLHPFGQASKIYLLAFLILGLSFFIKKIPIWVGWMGFGIFIVGFLLHTYGFYLRCVIAGRPPVSNMYESVVWVSWGVCFFSAILFLIYRALPILLASSFVAMLALIIAEAFPALLDPTISPLVPVLRSNLWLTVHVLTITLSYAAFGLAWGLGHIVVFSYVKNPTKAEKNKMLAQYLYRALQIGVILLATGTVLGGVWANYSWGRFWGWDPKETWALIALLGYLAVLHGRFAGWLDVFGLAAASVIAFAGIVMAWYGVNYVLAAGLHSYGFGGGGAHYVLSVFLADFALILGLVLRYRTNKGPVFSKK